MPLPRASMGGSRWLMTDDLAEPANPCGGTLAPSGHVKVYPYSVPSDQYPAPMLPPPPPGAIRVEALT